MGKKEKCPMPKFLKPGMQVVATTARKYYDPEDPLPPGAVEYSPDVAFYAPETADAVKEALGDENVGCEEYFYILEVVKVVKAVTGIVDVDTTEKL